MEAICRDVADEWDVLDAAVAQLSAAEWAAPTPAAGWSIADQIGHLWFFDVRAELAMRDPEQFAADREALVAGARAAGGEITDASVQAARSVQPAELLDRWRAGRAAFLATAATVDPSTRVPWYGPAMSPRSFVTARLMETWAHGVDVVDTLGLAVPVSARLRHVAHIGVRARPFSYQLHGLTAPEPAPYVRLSGPDSEVWEWGDVSLTDRVDGPALDFCLAVVQRRHLADTSLAATGPAAQTWLRIAQAFAGSPGPGRAPSVLR